ncbi:unnamed protein product [Tilletia laevis]|uniref:JmjC domain-containing protein n=2 Tax=Tilletia TaxID=13289 RepID=A0A8T8SD57_9BASI|nr:hypothetical protein A4X03_0g9098 [Tilletia caries]CAD6953644.1 unnamed protein product [Tilletia laevis]CAD6890162.1 unnamed protein product [Tilletia caries]CAD6921876.1 unnamed protein product [Tilletia caries]CAD6942043.1 unnamed protein product [Tilletia caries]
MAYAKTPVSLLPDCSKSKALVGRSAEEKETALFHIASTLDADLRKECAAVYAAGDLHLTRADSCTSRQACDGCTRMVLAVFFSCPSCGLELCPWCFDLLKDEQLRQNATQEKLAMVEGPDSDNFLGCRAVATTNFATHAVEDFVLVTQVALDDLLWLSGLCTVIIQKVSQRALSAAEDEVKDLENDTEMVSVTSSAAQTGVEASTKPHRHFSITYERRFPGVVRRLLLFGDEVAVVNACPTTNLWTPSQIVKELANAPRLFTTVVSKDPADEP